HRGVIALVVPPAAVADHVDDDIAVEGLPVIESELGHVRHGFGVVAVDVEHRQLQALGHVGGVGGGAGGGGAGGESDLVVHQDVHRAAGAVSAQLGQLQRLGHHALSREGGITVDQHRQHRV